MSTLLDIKDINCRYGDKVIIESLSFSVPSGSIACLLGPSGCGKTTALRAIAGFENIYAGSIELDQQVISKTGSTLAPEQRRVGMVFQDYALFPHLNIADNIGFGLLHSTKDEKKEIIAQLLTLIKLEEYADSYPHQLSGGQQQRVALARALAPNPKLLLMDEPFSNLDTELRRSLSLEVRRILKERGTTAILVTHDQTEAFNVADKIGVMSEGKLLQWDNAQTLFHSPNSAFVAAFVSNGKCIPAELLSANRIRTAFGETVLNEELPEPADGNYPSAASVLVRPWNIMLAKENAEQCSAEITQQQFNGALTVTTVKLDDGTLFTSHDDALSALPLASKVSLSLSPQFLKLL